MVGKEKFVVPKRPLWEYIGDLSQDTLECSYNEDNIRDMWRGGRIDQEVRETLAMYPWRLEHWIREDGQYSDMLTALVIQHGGWSPTWGWGVPTDWTEEEWGKEGPPKVPVDPLSEDEQAIVDAFLAKYEIVTKE